MKLTLGMLRSAIREILDVPAAVKPYGARQQPDNYQPEPDVYDKLSDDEAVGIGPLMPAIGVQAP